MFLDGAHEKLGWPCRDEVLYPKGTGAKLTVQRASEKLGRALRRMPGGEGVNVGILAANPDSTEPPIAIVCEFPKKASGEALAEAHRLAWNFCQTRLLITIEPHIVRKWSCCEPPAAADQTSTRCTPEIGPEIRLSARASFSLSDQAAASLHWVELLSGRFFQQHEQRFAPEKRADQMLLRNLKEVRGRLIDEGLDDDTSHDLLARVIFIQFLFHRKDANGKAALDSDELHRLHGLGELAGSYDSLGGVLNDYEDTYALFRWLNGRFNGDLFPGKGTPEEQESAWAAERLRVKPQHLGLLARFVGGEESMKHGQASLWRHYAFDAIPLEFISTIYEQFVRKEDGTGIHYTPAHIVDMMLDSVLPWDSDEWDLKILDPACGSGVFLVKAFQRIIHRWKVAHPDERITGEDLGRMLNENLFGVDSDSHAVRVASFSLYLAMCDEIDPRYYWKEVQFPVLRDVRLIADDFFSESHRPFHSIFAHSTYDLVIGNPPWGKNTASTPARKWAKRNNWKLPYGDFGPLFLAKALALVKRDGYVALLQPASTLLYNSRSPARTIRSRIFQKYHVEEVINLAAVRYLTFKDSIVPACAIVMRNSPCQGEAFWYSCPKPLHTQEDAYRVVIEPQDIHRVYPEEVESRPWIWSALMWGGRRDVSFLDRLSRYTTLAALEKEKRVKARQGIIRGTVSTEYPELLDRPLLTAKDYPMNGSLFLDAERLAPNTDPRVNSVNSHDFTVFDLPQAIIKQSWMENERRFRAALIRSNPSVGGVVCTDSYLSIHATDETEGLLETICLGYNSVVAVYHLLLSSGRFAMDRNEPQAEALRMIPLPEPRPGLLGQVKTIEGIDDLARRVYEFKAAEWILIEDLIHYTLPDYKEGVCSPGRRPTSRRATDNDQTAVEPELTAYCHTLRQVLCAGFGDDKQIGTAIFSESTGTRLPVRMVSIHLNCPLYSAMSVEKLDAPKLQERLTKLYMGLLDRENGKSYYQRTVRTYDTLCVGDTTGIVINLIKPDQVRYWTRSMGMRDADEIAADFLLWQEEVHPTQAQEQKVTGG